MAIVVKALSHRAFMTGKSAEITIGGNGFVAPMVVIINGVRIPCHYANGFMAKFILPYIPAGKYDITVANGDETSFVFRQALTITDPDPSLNVPALGSAGRPIVLPPRVIKGEGTAKLSSAAKIRKYETPAKVVVDTKGTDTTAYKTADPSVMATEPVPEKKVQESDVANTVLETPFGEFRN